MLDSGWEARGSKEIGWILKKGNFMINFDIRINTPKSCVWVGYFKRCGKEITATLIEDDKKKIRLHVNEAHELLGHAGGEDRIRCTTTALGMELKRGRMYKCEPVCNRKSKTKEYTTSNRFVE